jgi:hypothetical protein
MMLRIISTFLSLFLSLVPALGAQPDAWQQAEENARQAAPAIHLANRNTFGWLAHADPATGLFPRNLTDSAFWNAQDSAADNYPFMVLTAWMTDNYHLKQSMLNILAQEKKLTSRIDSLPDDFAFATQKFRTDPPDFTHIIFGAAEYAKDGLIPITEWMGPSPWLDRMQGLIADIWKNAPVDSPGGKLPSGILEVNGDLLQTMGRLYWLTGDDRYKNWCFRLADRYLLETSLLDADSLPLRDHGCEIIGGLSEAYVMASREDPDRAERYRPRIHAILDSILAHGLNEDGLMFNAFNPRTGQPVGKGITDNWGYVYNAFLTVAMLDEKPGYREAVARGLASIHKAPPKYWTLGMDEMADSVEGAINLCNRLPDASALQWVDECMKLMFAAQRPDGTLEGWHGDGNSTRTALMYALWKTQGITASPWTEDLQIGAAREADGTLRVWLQSGWSWAGRLRFDRPRHRDYFHMPFDYPRINQLPEWFAVEVLGKYSVQPEGGAETIVTGEELLSYPLSLKANQPSRLTIKPIPQTAAQRTMRYTSRPREAAVAWQKELRGKFFDLLKLGDLRRARIPLDAKIVSTGDKGEYTHHELLLRSTPKSMIEVVLTIPKDAKGPCPAVVCINGHGGNRHIVYNPSSPYKAFADALARKGYITIATGVGQHEVREPDRTLMGERLWDLMRCVDYLESRPEVDRKKIGCAGLSLGGEMSMWLAAMDERVAATVSSGYLTTMDQMEIGHCMCWKFDGLRELADWADVYALAAPRAMQCQNGLSETPDMFIVPLARQALREIQPIYQDLGAPDALELCVHPGGHVVDVPSLLSFFERRFK